MIIGPSQLREFEDRYWSNRDQKPVWRHQAALELVIEKPVLDVGGGDGLFLSILKGKKFFSQLTLIDFSPVAVKKAQEKGLEAFVVDVTKPFPFPDNSFATACALDVLEHLNDPLFTLKEMTRVAKWVVIVVPNFHYWKERGQMFIGQVPFQCRPQRGHIFWFNYTILKNLIAQAGLEINAVIYAGFHRLGPIGKWLANAYPSLFAHSFAVRLRKRNLNADLT